MSYKSKRWVVKAQSSALVEEIKKNLNVSDWLARILVNRGYIDIGLTADFLDPKLSKLHDPELLSDVYKAVDRIVKAIDNHENILIFGDYDVDGVTSTSILYRFLKQHTEDVFFFLPNREKHGYGLTKEAILELLQRSQPKLIITVDCGISSIDEVSYLKSLGIDTIITDHHEIGDKLPEAIAVINPRRNEKPYPFQDLSGVGVVFKLLQALSKKLKTEDSFLQYIDITAIGTIADVVSLTDENRIIVKYGLEKLKMTQNKGLLNLIQASGLQSDKMTARSLAFTLSPRINAAGRMSEGSLAVNLLITEVDEEAVRLSQMLCDLNKRRQETEVTILLSVMEKAEEESGEDSLIFVIDGNGWHQGVLGIIASRVVDKYYKPCMIISFGDDNIGRGSGRSIEGFNIFEALKKSDYLLEKYGGHELAGGLTIRRENFQTFKNEMLLFAKETFSDVEQVANLNVDMEIDADGINIEKIQEIDRLAPFGEGNPEPLFLVRNLEIKASRLVGEGKHIKLIFATDTGIKLNGIAFNFGKRFDELKVGSRVDLVASLEINEWANTRTASLNIKDISESKKNLLSNNFYLGLRHSISSKAIVGDEYKSFPNQDDKIFHSEEEILSYVTTSLKKNEKIAFLVNDLAGIGISEKLISLLSDSMNYGYYYDYNNCEIIHLDGISVFLNPSLEDKRLPAYATIIIVGGWFCPIYLNIFIKRLDVCSIFFYNCINKSEMESLKIVPMRQDIEQVFFRIKRSPQSRIILSQEDMILLADELTEKSDCELNYFKLNQCFRILEELGIVTITDMQDQFEIILNPNLKERKDLNSSKIYQNLQSMIAYLDGGLNEIK